MKSKDILPHRKTPCKDCPFRKDCTKGWLGKDRIEEIANTGSFVCHKNTALQCAGHMIFRKENNDFVRLAKRMKFNIDIKKTKSIFESYSELVKHHSNKS